MNGWMFGDIPPLSADFIWADPPWRFEVYSDLGIEKSAQAQYDCMTVEEIASMPVGHLARADCWLWLWATHPMIHQALHVMERWGFKFVTSGVWVKRGVDTPKRRGKLAFGTGYVLRCASEPFLIGKIGKPPYFSKSIRTVIEAPRRQHSRKPEKAFEVAETFSGNVDRIELFARKSRAGWRTWGNQSTLFDAGDPATMKRPMPLREQAEPEPMPLFQLAFGQN